LHPASRGSAAATRVLTQRVLTASWQKEVCVARIAIVASARFPLRRPFAGGLEALTYHLATRLRARGHEVVIYASADSDPTLGARPIVSEALRLELTEAAKRDPSMVAEPFLEEHHAYLALMLELQGGGVDVVHNHALHYLPIAMAPGLPVPVLTTLHTPPTPWLESAMATLPRSATNVSFVSVSQANARSWRCRERIDVVPNGIPLDDWPYQPEPTGDHLVWFGRLVPEKGAHLAVDVARRCGRRLLLAGPVGDAAYVREAITPRLGADVEYAGHLDLTELAALVGSAAAVLATPRWEEPYGLTVPESLACGTPVVAFRRGAMPELLDEATGVLVAPDDVEAMAAAVEVAVTRDRAACRRRAETTCSIEAMTDRYEALYAELAA
jgi:glycosyltransferase involved in cell wall biosynthesis